MDKEQKFNYRLQVPLQKRREMAEHVLKQYEGCVPVIAMPDPIIKGELRDQENPIHKYMRLI